MDGLMQQIWLHFKWLAICQSYKKQHFKSSKDIISAFAVFDPQKVADLSSGEVISCGNSSIQS